MESRSIAIKLFVVGAGILLVFRLAQLQIFDHSYRIRGDAATVEKEVLYPSRGIIYDRNDNLLVFNQPIYDLYVNHYQLDSRMDTSKLCQILNLDIPSFESKINKDWSDVRFSRRVPFLFQGKIDAVTFGRLQEVLHEYPGFLVRVRNVRGYNYPYAAHALGYISEVDQERISKSGEKYKKGDYAGVTGIEDTYEIFMRGRKGIEYQLKDNFGRRVGSYESGKLDSAAVSGFDIETSLDMHLQAYAERLMEGKVGSIVAIEPESGEILTMVSSPSYDPALLSGSADRSEAFLQLQEDSLKPFFNRATMAKYPPGSTIKPVFALIALQEGILTTDRHITCRGGYYYNTYRWGCHARPGSRNVVVAIQQSCNTFFYMVFRELIDKYGFDKPELGLQNLNDYLYSFGLGRPIHIDLSQESGGHIPNSDFYDSMYVNKGDWRSTYIISNAIGQGEVELTTLQMANLAVIIGNRGYYYYPHLIKSFKRANLLIPSDYRNPKRALIDDEHFDPVISGMERSTRMGTSRMANIPGVSVCGKTGTSENPHGKDHSVFYGFAPSERPKIAIAVFIENGGWGGSYAAPIAGLIMEKYLKNDIHPSKIWIEDRMIQTNLIANL